jgi:NAD(P)-dependent dehydrogenase (short-subunit alcohol dehydrogenase family)
MTMELFNLEGKVALVTGGSRGVGRMMAQGLVDAGATVYLSSRKSEACEEAAAALSERSRAFALPADVSSEEGCRSLAERLGQREPRLHVLVNNAGTMWAAPLADYPAAGFDKVVDLNLKAPFFLTRACLPLLQAAAEADDPARVINVGSIDGIRVPAFATYAYSASKAGLHHLTAVLARELGPLGITVNALAPGPFESRMMAATLEAFGAEIAAASPLGRIGRASDLAGTAVYLASRASAYLTGIVLALDGGIATTR